MEKINSELLKKMLESGCNNLSNQRANIDALNVFPVPDGDTGTNMSLTFCSGVKDALNATTNQVGENLKVLSKGLLMGARGNSGVITSQIFRGIAQSADGLQEMDAQQLSAALVNGAHVAYKAVMRPVEGTILTVIREASDYTEIYVKEHSDSTCKEALEKFVEEAKISLDHTPELLPVLKEVGVVDSGGAGLLAIFEGFLSAMNGVIIEKQTTQENVEAAGVNVESDEFGYCTEFIIQLNNYSLEHFSEDQLREELSRIGDSLVCVQDEDIVKVHVHTLEPQTALKLGKRHGNFVKIKIENMQEQHEHLSEEEGKAESEYAIISVAAGAGLKEMFKELRTDYVISGGQTMNPSTEDFVAAIKKMNAKHIFLLPNNSNIILAAQQAVSVCEDVDVHVIPTKSIPQGLSACMMFNPEADVDTNVEEMNDAMTHVKTGQVTYAIKDTTFEGMDIKAQDYMGIYEKDIVISVKDKIEATKTLLTKMLHDEDEIVTLIYGEDVSEEEAQLIEKYILDNYEVEVEMTSGKQPVYAFIIGVE